MKKVILVLLIWLIPALSFAASKQDLCYTTTNQDGVEGLDTISASRAVAADLFAVDFEPDLWDSRRKNRVKFSIQLTPETAAAKVNLVCDMWNGTTNVTAVKQINGGTALPLAATFDFDVIVHQKTTNCNLVVVDGGTQDWTAEICKTYNSSR